MNGIEFVLWIIGELEIGFFIAETTFTLADEKRKPFICGCHVESLRSGGHNWMWDSLFLLSVFICVLSEQDAGKFSRRCQPLKANPGSCMIFSQTFFYNNFHLEDGKLFGVSHPRRVCVCMCMLSRVRLFVTPCDCSLPGSSAHRIFPGKNTGVNGHFLLQRIFVT